MHRTCSRLGLIAAALLGCSASEPEAPAPAPAPRLEPGPWRATLTVPGGALPFRLAFEEGAEGAPTRAFLVNGDDRAAIKELSWENGRLRLGMPGFDAVIEARLQGKALEGALTQVKRGGRSQVLRFRANPDDGFLKPPAPAGEVSGRWATRFVDGEGAVTEAVGLFEQDRSGAVRGTFMTPTGDYRFLAGVLEGDRLRLSCFDGAHAFLFTARLQGGEKGERLTDGHFWSGQSWHETWTAERDPQAKLPDAMSLTRLRPGLTRLAFSFPNLDKEPVSLEDDRYQGKVVLVSILGTWCPNCHDEAAFLGPLIKELRPRGLEAVGLLYEHTEDFERSARQGRAFRDKFSLDFELLIAGSSDKKEAAATLPMLDRVLSYPTAIFIDRRGEVRAIHTGFTGPGTGQEYRELTARFRQLLQELLDEGGGERPANGE